MIARNQATKVAILKTHAVEPELITVPEVLVQAPVGQNNKTSVVIYLATQR